MVSVDGSFDGYNGGKLEDLFIGDSLGSSDDNVIGSEEFIKLESIDGEVPDVILVKED